ncbi:MAG: hypothetical protein M3Q82_06500 [Actinomycetota bacterium]|nr:hypothetical protein [Actinomycetota bacterium]
MPHPYTPADRAAGFGYDLSILQAEFSLTQMLDRPVSGRIFFEQVIRDNLDIGRPNQVSLIFNRRIHAGKKRTTQGRFRTRVITEEVTPSLHVDYKHTTIKQDHTTQLEAAKPSPPSTTHHHRDRHPGCRTPFRRPPRPGPLLSIADLPAPTQRFHQP